VRKAMQFFKTKSLKELFLGRGVGVLFFFQVRPQGRQGFISELDEGLGSSSQEAIRFYSLQSSRKEGTSLSGKGI